MLKKLIYSSFVIILIVNLHITSVAAIYCFQCSSLHDPECEIIMPNDTSSVFYRECRPESPDAIGREMFCRKIVQTIHDRDGIVRVIRRCGWIMHQKRDCYTVSNKGHVEEVCQCFSDGCNSATKYLMSPYLIITATLSLLFYSRY